MDNQQWGLKLSEAYKAKTSASGRSGIRAPAADKLLLGGTADHLVIRLSNAAANECNMQEAAGAFDGWLFAIRHWLCVESFEIDLEDGVALEAGHGGRTWYRVRTLQRLLGDKLRLGPALSRAMALAPWRDATTIWLNVAEKGRSPKLPQQLQSEADYELALCYDHNLSDAMGRAFGLQRNNGADTASPHWILCRQFPVGMFDRDPYSGNGWMALGPKGKSAVDLVGVGADRTFHLFELKKPDATAVGALSELLFYTALLSDARAGNRQVRFGNRALDPSARVRPEHLLDATAIAGHLLAPDIHPLLTPTLFAEVSQLAADADMAFSLAMHRLGETIPEIANYPSQVN
jgi:hypothetical protein